jgi:hypothetical protein
MANNGVHFRLTRGTWPAQRAVRTLLMRRYLPLALLVCVGAPMLSLLSAAGGHPVSWSVINALVVFGVLLVALPTMLYGTQSKTYWAIAGDAASLDCQLDAEGVHVKTDDSSASSPWRAFSGFAETKGAFVLLSQSYPILVVPKTDIGGEPDISAVRSVLSARVRPAKARPL